MSRFRDRLASWVRDQNGVAAIEFAFVMPILVVLLLAGTEYCRALSLYRKVTLTTRSVTDLTTQYVQMTDNNVTTVLNASAQIMSPFDNANLKIILSQVNTDVLGVSRYDWSRTFPSTLPRPPQGQIISLPAGSAQPGTSVILSQVSYAYTPTFGAQVVGPLQLSDRISMSPRLAASVTLISP